MSKEQPKHHERPIKIHHMTARTQTLLEQKLAAYKKADIQYSLDIGQSGDTNDFHDNFAFDEANRNHERTLAQIANLENILKDVAIVTPRKETDTVGIGNEVYITYEGEDPMHVTVLYPLDAANCKDHSWISYESLLGKTLLGHKEGDTVQIPSRDDAGRLLSTHNVTVHAIMPGRF